MSVAFLIFSLFQDYVAVCASLLFVAALLHGYNNSVHFEKETLSCTVKRMLLSFLDSH